MPVPGQARTDTRTDERTTQKDNASCPVYWMGGDKEETGFGRKGKWE